MIFTSYNKIKTAIVLMQVQINRVALFIIKSVEHTDYAFHFPNELRVSSLMVQTSHKTMHFLYVPGNYGAVGDKVVN